MEELFIKLIIPILILFVLLALNLPIFVAILGATFYVQIFVNQISIDNIFVTMYQGIARPSILAVPFFIIAGNLVDGTGMGKHLINFIMPMFRRVRGGAPISGVVANAFFGAISGSAPAAVATIGKLTYEPIAKVSGEKTSLGIIASSGSLATIIPPSLTMILFGVATGVSVGQLFIAGIIPGLIIIAVLAIYLVIISKPTEKITIKWDKWYQVIPALMMPIIVLGGIYGGLFTPTEAGAVSAVYVFIITIIANRGLNWAKLKPSLTESTQTIGKLFILVASSLAFADALTFSGVINLITDSLGGLHPFAFLVIVNIILLIAGCFFEPGSIVLILAPLVYPVATSIGIEPIHLGIIFTVNVSIGMFTPPFGLNLFVTQGVLKQPFEKIASAALPYVAIYIVCLLIITYIPILSTWLPQMMM